MTSLPYRLQTSSGVPIYLQLMEQIRHAISCAISPGDQLPAIRVLAQQLVISPNTVVKAYTELDREGTSSSARARAPSWPIATFTRAAIKKCASPAPRYARCRRKLRRHGLLRRRDAPIPRPVRRAGRDARMIIHTRALTKQPR